MNNMRTIAAVALAIGGLVVSQAYAGIDAKQAVNKAIGKAPLTEVTARVLSLITSTGQPDQEAVALAALDTVLTKHPALAPTLVGSIAAKVPQLAAKVAARAVVLCPKQTREILHAAALAAPKQAAEIAVAVVKVAPKNALKVAEDVMLAVPEASASVASAVATTAPETAPVFERGARASGGQPFIITVNKRIYLVLPFPDQPPMVLDITNIILGADYARP
jgi:hypothetical protein